MIESSTQIPNNRQVLKKGNYNEEQSNIKVDIAVIKQTMATKTDIAELRSELKSTINTEFSQFRNEINTEFSQFKSEINNLDNRLESKLESITTDIGWLKTITIANFTILLGGIITIICTVITMWPNK